MNYQLCKLANKACFLIVYAVLFFPGKYDTAATCSCSRNGKGDSMFKELKLSILSMTDKQIKELEQLKNVFSESNECPSFASSHLIELEKQIFNIQSLFDDSGLELEREGKNVFGSCTSALENFYTTVSNAAENNRKSIEELQREKEKFVKEKEEQIALIEKDYKQKNEFLETSLKQMKTLLDEKTVQVNKDLDAIKTSLKNGEKSLLDKISHSETSVLSKVCNCPSTDTKLEEMTELIQNSKTSQENIKKEMENNVNQQKQDIKALEEKFNNQQIKLDQVNVQISTNVGTMTGRITALENLIKNIETSTAIKISEIETSVSSKACNCPSVNGKLDELNNFMNSARKNLVVNRFFVIDGSFTWDQAENICKEYGTTLASIRNIQEQRLAESAMRSIIQTGAWMGLKSNGRKDGIFQWNNGMTINSKNKNEGFQKWHPVNPEDYPKGPVCGRILRTIAFGLWADDVCGMKQSALCESPI